MRLDIQLNAQLDDDTIAKLARVVAGIEDGWHKWATPDPANSSLDTYFDQNPTHRELLEKSYSEAIAYDSGLGRTLVVVVDARSDSVTDTWSLDESIAYLAQPLEVLVENRRNDGRFYLACLRAVAPESALYFSGLRPAANFSQAGGKSEVVKLIEDRLAYARESHTVPPRLLVVLDSDARFPGHLNAESVELRSVCKRFGIPLTLLEKRSIENYIGDTALTEYRVNNTDVAPTVAFLHSLDPKQRDHYPVKSGIKLKAGVLFEVSDQERRLYSGVSWPKAFVPKLPRLMEFVLSQPGVLDRDDLSEREATDEFEALARRIEENI